MTAFRFILPAVLIALFDAGSGCAPVAKIPVYELRPGSGIEIVNLGGRVNNTGDDYAPSLDPDEISLYFSSHRDDEYGIYRIDIDPADMMPVDREPMRHLMSGFRDGTVAFSGNGERIVFASCDCDLYEVRIVGSAEPTMRNLGKVNTEGWESQPTLSYDGTLLCFTGQTISTRGTDILTHSDIRVSMRERMGHGASVWCLTHR